MASSDSPNTAAPAAPAAAQSYSTDPALYIYTSLTAGSSHIVTATSRLETILRANRVPFKAVDLATDDKARMLWGRRAGKDEGGRARKLPGLVQMGLVLGGSGMANLEFVTTQDLVEIEDWNEYGELKQHVTLYYDEFTQPPIGQAPKTPAAQPAKPSSLAASSTAPSAGIPSAPAAPPAPPMPEKKETTPGDGADEKKEGGGVAATVAETAKKVTMPIRSIAEEAAAKAKAVHLQSLRDKVYGKEARSDEKDTKAEEKVEETAAPSTDKPLAADDNTNPPEAPQQQEEPTPSSPTPTPLTPRKTSDASSIRVAGMQSPTTGAWKDGPSTDNVLRTLQSPTTTSWKPTDVDAPITCYRGSLVASASEEEIAAIERAETIEEEEEPDSSEGEGDGGEEKKKVEEGKKE
ncbi:hypothetical protein GE09DRAFT_1249152 [Coniochaeta sp. 2T2.1]|nr:hypothetical protein GE09DRAFT_1249152 [Coniochaeta sp. 2T2.1]